MRRLNARLGLLAFTAVVAVLGSCAVAAAQTYTVTNLGNTGIAGDGSLRGEVAAANANPGADTVVFASGVTGTISFTATGIVISDPLDIEGPGPGVVTVQQTAAHRVFEIEAIAGQAVTIAGLHISGGTAPAGGANPEEGGDIFNAGSSLTLSNDLITGGKAEVGGGVDSDKGPMVLRGSTVSGNEAKFDGGVVAGDAGAPWAILSSTVSGNQGEVGGGLGLETAATGLIEDSTVSGNRAEVGAGGELEISAGGQVTIRASTIAANVAAEYGGGLTIEAGPGGSMEILDSTIAANSAADYVGGISWESDAALPIENSIVADNQAPELDDDIYSETGTISSAFSLIGEIEAAHRTEIIAGSDLFGTDPKLAPLADNGGPTETMALSAASPAVNKGASTLATDQRGLTRPVAYPGIAEASAPGANGADIGAFELQAPPSPAAPAPGPAPESPRPSNHFKLGKVSLNRGKGTALLSIDVPGPGVLSLTGTKEVKAVRKSVARAGVVKLLVKAEGRSLRTLRQSGSAKVKVVLGYTPSGGTEASVVKRLRLLETTPPPH
jgi:hypothetical protein